MLFYIVVTVLIIGVFAPLEKFRLKNESNKVVYKSVIRKPEKVIQTKLLYQFEPKNDIDKIKPFKPIIQKTILKPVFETLPKNDTFVPLKAIKAKKKHSCTDRKKILLPGISKKTIQFLKNHPSCIEESILHYFLLGGTLETAIFYREMGYKSYKDLRPFFGLYSAKGAKLDTLYENDLFSGVKLSLECRDFENKVIETLQRYPSKGRMSERLKELNTFEPTFESYNFEPIQEFETAIF